MRRLDSGAIDLGKTDSPSGFNRSGDGPNDWQFLTVTTHPWFQPYDEAAVRVIVTPNNQTHATSTHVCAPVPLVSEFNDGSFTIAARNADCADGEAGFNWMVIAEESPKEQPPVDVRIGVAQPRVLEQSCERGDWAAWNQPYSEPFRGKEPATFGFATAGHIGPTGQTNTTMDQHTVPAANARNTTVQYADNPIAAQMIAYRQAPLAAGHPAGLGLMARNTDEFRGVVAPNWLAASFAPDAETSGSSLYVDSGRTDSARFQMGGHQDGWQFWEVPFSRPFESPPVVQLTCTAAADTWAPNLDQRGVPVVGIVMNVTRFGFTLCGRNSDLVAGQSGFYWVAVGCGVGCG